ncbi:acyltransferase family protein [Mucilaginibacter sp. PAMB04274]|uniref:acyltransferase family protein n=1 Tax=Mucilaginibacter sp. PAMB04274 TaxID=3138568 RepID=UPI0031F70460
MYFYLLVCLMICLKKNIYRNLLLIIAALATVGTFLDPVNPLIKFLTSPLLLEFGMGVICGLIYERANTIAFSNNTYKFVSVLLVVLGIGLSCISLFILPTHNGNILGELTTVANNNMAALKRVIIMGVPSAIFLIGVVLSEKHFNIKIPYILILCGDASYSCYLIHMHTYPAIAKVFNALHINTNIFLLLLIPICLGISVIFYRIVEMPLTRFAEKITHRFLPQRKFVAKPV